MKNTRLVKFTKWSGNESSDFGILFGSTLETMTACFITKNGVGDETAIACPAEWEEISISDLPENMDFDGVVYVLENAGGTFMVEGEDAVDYANDYEWICSGHEGCEYDGKSVGHLGHGAENIVAHFAEHGEKPIMLIDLNFYQKRVQHIFAVVPKNWNEREADMRLSGYENDDWKGSIEWLIENNYLS